MSEGISAAADARAFKAPFQYEYPQASPCGAVLIYCKTGHNKLSLITSVRSDFEGAHKAGRRNQAAGGFYEVGEMFNQVSKVQDGDAELYREMMEELGEDIVDIISYEDFKKRREYLWDGMTRVGNTQFVHMQVHKTLEVTKDEFFKILALPPTEERAGFKVEAFEYEDNHYLAEKPEDYVRDRLKDFLYPVEVDMAVRWFKKIESKAKDEFTPASNW